MSEASHRISVVADLTKLTAATIRMWEHRYGAVKPGRTSGKTRLYSRADVERLSMLKAAVDRGHAISTVATLDREALAGIIGNDISTRRPRPSRRPQALICGADLASRLRESWARSPAIQVRDSLAAFDEGAFDTVAAADVMIIDLPFVSADLLAPLRRVITAKRPHVTIIIYGVASRKILDELAGLGVIALTSPVRPKQIQQLCLNAFKDDVDQSRSPATGSPTPERRYDDAFIAKLAQLQSDVLCECPNHIADIIGKMVAFEQYSRSCEASNPKDALVHAYLQTTAARCIAILEDAVDFLIEHEDLAIA